MLERLAPSYATDERRSVPRKTPFPLGYTDGNDIALFRSLQIRDKMADKLDPCYQIVFIRCFLKIKGLLGIVWVNVHDNQMDIAETAHRDG